MFVWNKGLKHNQRTKEDWHSDLNPVNVKKNYRIGRFFLFHEVVKVPMFHRTGPRSLTNNDDFGKKITLKYIYLPIVSNLLIV